MAGGAATLLVASARRERTFSIRLLPGERTGATGFFYSAPHFGQGPEGDQGWPATTDPAGRSFAPGPDIGWLGSGDEGARVLAPGAARRWGRVVFVGEGIRVDSVVNRGQVDQYVALHGSQGTHTAHLMDIIGDDIRWGLLPQVNVHEHLPLSGPDAADRTASGNQGGTLHTVRG